MLSSHLPFKEFIVGIDVVIALDESSNSSKYIVKKSNLLCPIFSKSHFLEQSRVCLLGRLSHPNLVEFLGYCLEDEELFVVHEYMQNGSLENHLFRSEV